MNVCACPLAKRIDVVQQELNHWMGLPTSDATWQGKTYCFFIRNCFLLRGTDFATHMKAGGPVESGLQTCHNKYLAVNLPNNLGF